MTDTSATHRRASNALLALSLLLVFSLLAFAPAAHAFTTRAPIALFGPNGPAACPGFNEATGTGNIDAAGGTADRTALGTGTGRFTKGSTTVTSMSVTSGNLAVGESITVVTGGGAVPDGTTIAAIDAGAKTLTLSQSASESSQGSANGVDNFISGSKTLINVNVTAGTFKVGMSISGSGIQPGTTITAVGAGTITLSRGVANVGTMGTADTSITAGFPQVTSASAGCGAFAVGQTITGAGIPSGTKITAAVGGTLTLSKTPTAPGTGVTLNAVRNFEQLNSLAFNQAADRLYAFDIGASSIACFSAPANSTCGGSFPLAVSPSQPFGNQSAAGIAVDNSGLASAGHLLYPTTNSPSTSKVFGFDSTGAALGGKFPLSITQHDMNNIAVDSVGNIWVVGTNSNTTESTLSKFAADGSALGSPITLNIGKILAIAIDSANNVYVATTTNVQPWAVYKLTAASGYDPAQATKLPGGSNSAITGLAVDRTNNRVYVAGGGSPRAYDSSGNLLYSFGQTPGGGPEASGVVVDESTDRAYLGDFVRKRIWVFGPPASYPDSAAATVNAATNVSYTTADLGATIDDGSVLATGWTFQVHRDGVVDKEGNPIWTKVGSGGTTQGSQSGVAVSAAAKGLTTNSDYQFRLITDKGPGSPETIVDGPTFHTLTIPPATATIDPAANVTDSSAELHASITDNNSFATKWRFELSKDGGASWFAAKHDGTPISGSTAGNQTGASVGGTVNGLDPNTTYGLRVVTNKGPGTPDVPVSGSPFTTDAVPPVLSKIGTFRLSDTSVYLVGTVDPRFASTDYHFDWGPTSALENATPTESAGAGGEPVVVTELIDGLNPDSDYHFRLSATNVADTTESAVFDFHTRADPPPAPDERAYEMVSPVEKEGGAALSGSQAATTPAYDGQAIGFCTTSSFGDEPPEIADALNACASYVSRRTSSGWVTRGLIPPYCGVGEGPKPRLSLNADAALIRQTEPGGNCGLPTLDPAAQTPARNLYSFDPFAEPRDYELLTPTGGGAGSLYGGSSDDFSHVFFTSDAQQAADAPAGSFDKLYERTAGVTRLVSKDTSNASFTGAAAMAGYGSGFKGDVGNDVSATGSRVFFQTPATSNGDCTANNCELYMRQNGSATYWVSQQECSPACADNSAPDVFQWAAPDGSKALFTTTAKLNNDDGNNSGADLYLYTHSGNPAVNTNLTLLSKDSEPADGILASVERVLGASDDGNTVYFTASGQLVAGEPTSAGTKLYRWQKVGATITLGYLGTLNEDPIAAGVTRNVTPDGKYLLTLTTTRLDPVTDRDSDRDFYRWDQSGGWACVSCQLPGAPSLGDAEGRHSFIGSENNSRPRVTMTDDGQRIFFSSPDPLVEDDVNDDGGCPRLFAGTIPACLDVYEWHDGALQLISSGTGSRPSYLEGVGHDGKDVFFYTYERLVGWDGDVNGDIYDARIGGGFPEPQPEVPCDLNAGACEGAPSVAQSSDGAGTKSFEGAGDPPVSWKKTGKEKRCPKGESKVKRKGKARCVKHRAKKHKHRRAKHERRAGR